MAALQSSRLATHHEGKISELQATTINQLNPISSPDLQRSMKRHVLKKSSSTQELRKGDNRMAQMIGSTDENRCVFKRTRNGSNDATVLELPTQRLEEANLSCMIFGTPAKDRIQRELGRSRSLSRLRSRVRPSVDDGECHHQVPCYATQLTPLKNSTCLLYSAIPCNRMDSFLNALNLLDYPSGNGQVKGDLL
jgi:hypothetical protein